MAEPMTSIESIEPMVHVRFEGMSRQLSLSALNLAPTATDAEVLTALAGYFDVAVERFVEYVVDRHENGNITVRPEAVFG